MGFINTSKDQALLVTDSMKEKAQGIPKGKEPKASYSNPKKNQNTSKGASSSKKFEKKKCPYCMRGFYPEDSCMKKTLEQLKNLLVQTIFPFHKVLRCMMMERILKNMRD